MLGNISKNYSKFKNDTTFQVQKQKLLLEQKSYMLFTDNIININLKFIRSNKENRIDRFSAYTINII